MVVDFQGRSGPTKKKAPGTVNLTWPFLGKQVSRARLGAEEYEKAARKVIGLWDLIFF